MRTTINLPDELIKKALDVTHCRTKKELFTMALKNIIVQSEITGLKKYKGKVSLDIDLDVTRGRE